MRRNTLFVSVFMIIMIVFCLAGCGGGRPLSKRIVGTWNGKLDVASMLSYELSREMGLDEKIFDPNPVYSDIQITFNKDSSGELIVDLESFTKATEEVMEPYISLLVGFDTKFFVEMLFEAALQDMDPNTGKASFTYEVDDKENVVYLKVDSGEEGILLYKDGKLEIGTDIMGTKIVFEK